MCDKRTCGARRLIADNTDANEASRANSAASTPRDVGGNTSNDNKKNNNVTSDSQTEPLRETRNQETTPIKSTGSRTVCDDASCTNLNRTGSKSPNVKRTSASSSETDDESIRELLMLHLAIAEALIEMLPENERSLPTEWHKIIKQERHSSGIPLEEAAQYARYLSLALATSVVTQAPFHQSPPLTLGEASGLTSAQWSSMLASCSLDVTWARDLASNSSDCPVSPKDFFKSQPTPPCGAICYMAAVSDMPLF